MSKPNTKRRAQGAPRLSRTQAVRRLDKMIPLIVQDMEIALALEATLESANDIVQANHHKGQSYTAHCFNTVHNAIALNLVMGLARLYDEGTRSRHPNTRDVASIPLMVRLLRQAGCKKTLIERAMLWTPNLQGVGHLHAKSCKDAIKNALDSYARLRRSKTNRAAVDTLKKFRDKKIAHSLMSEMLDTLPRYNQLFMLMDIARDVVEHANLAIDGRHIDFKDEEKERRRQADAFWGPALGAAMGT